MRRLPGHWSPRVVPLNTTAQTMPSRFTTVAHSWFPNPPFFSLPCLTIDCRTLRRRVESGTAEQSGFACAKDGRAMVKQLATMQHGRRRERNRRKLFATGALLRLRIGSLQLTKIGDKTLELPSIELRKIGHLRLWLEGLCMRDPSLKIGVVVGYGVRRQILPAAHVG